MLDFLAGLVSVFTAALCTLEWKLLEVRDSVSLTTVPLVSAGVYWVLRKHLSNE